MANFQVFKSVSKGRTRIRVAVTPKSKETRALLREFNAGVKDFEKKWKATKAYQEAQKKKKKKTAKKK